MLVQIAVSEIVSGADMLSVSAFQIKTILASVTTGRTLIPALRDLIHLDCENFLEFFMKPFADYNPMMEVPLGMTKTRCHAGTNQSNRVYAQGLLQSLSIQGCLNDQGLALAFGREVEWVLSHHGTNGVICTQNSRSPVTCGVMVDGKYVSSPHYPNQVVTPGGAFRISPRALVYEIEVHNQSGQLMATFYLGCMNHIEASKAGETANKDYQKNIKLWLADCLDAGHCLHIAWMLVTSHVC